MQSNVSDVSERQTVTATTCSRPFMSNNNVELWDSCEFSTGLELGNKKTEMSLNSAIKRAGCTTLWGMKHSWVHGMSNQVMVPSNDVIVLK